MDRGQGQNGHPSGWPPHPQYPPNMVPRGGHAQAPGHHPLNGSGNGMMGQAWGGQPAGHFPASTFTPPAGFNMRQELNQHQPLRAYPNSTPNPSEPFIQHAHPHQSPGSGPQPFLPQSQPHSVPTPQMARFASGPQPMRRPDATSQGSQRSGTVHSTLPMNGSPTAAWQSQPQATSVAALRERFENHSQ